MVLTREQRIFVVEHHFLYESYALCQEAFQQAFPNDSGAEQNNNLPHYHEV
jgi:hypothetical protein